MSKKGVDTSKLISVIDQVQTSKLVKQQKQSNPTLVKTSTTPKNSKQSVNLNISMTGGRGT